MRWIASSGRRVTSGVLVATMVTLVGCGGTSIRRPLVTDETPLGTPRERVLAWHAENGWCRDEAPHPAADHQEVEWVRPCTGPDRHRLSTMLVFSSGDALELALVTVSVPPPSAVPPRTNVLGRSNRRSGRDLAIDVMEALASELEARHGAPDVSSWTERRWVTRDEVIRLEWKEIVEDTFVVTEQHSPPGPNAVVRAAR